MSASNKERKVPVLVDKPMDFCPGCGHGIISRLIMECLDELEQSDNIIFPIGVGCSSNLVQAWNATASTVPMDGQAQWPPA